MLELSMGSEPPKSILPMLMEYALHVDLCSTLDCVYWHIWLTIARTVAGTPSLVHQLVSRDSLTKQCVSSISRTGSRSVKLGELDALTH